MAKHVGEQWKVLKPEVKEDYEMQASTSKEKYNQALAEYKKTDSYRNYTLYLNEFKSRMNKEPQGAYLLLP